jgi:hypothetical protein
MQQSSQSYLFIYIFNNFFKMFEDLVDTRIMPIKDPYTPHNA